MSGLSFEYLDSSAFLKRMHGLLQMVDDIAHGKDTTLRVLREEAEKIGVPMVVIGGVAVIRHGYERTTKDRELFRH